MFRWIVSRLRFANVMAMIAVVLAIGGGTAIATHPFGTSTISSGDIIDLEVKTPDLATGAVTGAKVLDDSLGSSDINGIWSPDVVNDGLTGDDVREDTLRMRPPSLRTSSTAHDSTGSKFISATCPAGEHIVSGGFSLGGLIPEDVHDVTVWKSEPRWSGSAPPADRWDVGAVENDATSRSWQLTAWALCSP